VAHSNFQGKNTQQTVEKLVNNYSHTQATAA